MTIGPPQHGGSAIAAGQGWHAEVVRRALGVVSLLLVRPDHVSTLGNTCRHPSTTVGMARRAQRLRAIAVQPVRDLFVDARRRARRDDCTLAQCWLHPMTAGGRCTMMTCTTVNWHESTREKGQIGVGNSAQIAGPPFWTHRGAWTREAWTDNAVSDTNDVIGYEFNQFLSQTKFSTRKQCRDSPQPQKASTVENSTMDVERSSLCNCVVNFLLEENYLLSAFELLHELLDDGRDDQAIRLKQFFSDPAQFPPDQISRFNSLRVADPQSLFEEKESLEEKLAVREYELRLAQEDIHNIKAELLKKTETNLDESNGRSANSTKDNRQIVEQVKRDESFLDFGPLKDNERLDLNCAVKEYLLLAGYRLTAMTFYEEVTDQNLDVWQNSSACVPDALRHYYYEYLSSTAEGAEEKIALQKENDRLKSLVRNKEMSDAQVMVLTKSLESLQKDIKDKENLVHGLKKTLESQRMELNDCRAEITALKMHIEGYQSGKYVLATGSELIQPVPQGQDENNEIFESEVEMLKAKTPLSMDPVDAMVREEGNDGELDKAEDPQVNINESSRVGSLADLMIVDTEMMEKQHSDDSNARSEKMSKELPTTSGESGFHGDGENICKENGTLSSNTDSLLAKPDNLDADSTADKTGLGTIEILSNALPKIVPYVLINHREELLPLIMCAIERHPDCATRDSLTHTLFNLIKRPDEQQRQIIMDACVTLANNVGELRTETELLPQCWEQINHMYEERRLLVAQSCGELAEFVRPEIRDSLILSIVQQLIEDSATVVRESAAHNLALLLALFPNTDKYFKVEDMMFQLVCDPSGVVVETTIKDLVPALINWGDKLDHMLQVLLSHILECAQRCPPISGVEGSIESHLHALGERERWNVDVLLRLLAELLSCVHRKAVETCPISSVSDSSTLSFTPSLLNIYAEGQVEWPAFEWLHMECFPTLIQLSSLLPQKEDNIRNRISKFLLAVAERFGEPYLTHIMLPVFLVAVGDDADLKYFPFKAQIEASIYNSSEDCYNVCPTTSPGRHTWSPKQATFEENHGIVFNILWEMIASTAVNLKVNAAKLLKVIVPYIDAKVASSHVLPALVTLGSDQNLNVKYASIDAFGAVAQHFKNDMIVDKIRIQMDTFLEDGSHEATVAVIRALLVAVPHMTDKLRDYILMTFCCGLHDIGRRRERANAFCESIRALDATDLPVSSIKDYLLPAIQNLMKDTDALDPAHKEALEIILKERSGGTFETISKVMGAHLGLASSVSSFLTDSGLLGKKEIAGEMEAEASEAPKPIPPPLPEDTRFRRIMRGGFTDMLRGRNKSNEEVHPNE
ncbi:HEAT repeat-containing protein [Striga asiatica]|uniref:HEAT repeat-containing protein n=1 Tax=Striga asiatica TaxID=4170 RepID=A0A5A7QS43_STRAF|nr:HEAT repeat-containing protein [Striga asiatica]